MEPINLSDRGFYHKPVIASIVLLAATNIAGGLLSIYDLFYLWKIKLGKEVPESAHTFFIRKQEVEHWVSMAAYLFFIISFLTWFYRAYRSVYQRASSEAPYKPGIVPFSYFIPLFNLVAPYQIMRFIWWGNAATSEELTSGNKAINLWWFISVMNMIVLRIAALVNGKAVYAEEFIRGTYVSIFSYVLAIHFLFLTYKLVVNISRVRSYP